MPAHGLSSAPSRVSDAGRAGARTGARQPVPAQPPAQPPRPAGSLTIGAPLAAVAVAGAACGWAVHRAGPADRPLVAAVGALAAALLGVTVALVLCRVRMSRELRRCGEELRAEAGRTVAAQAEVARRLSAQLQAAHRAVRDAHTHRHTSAQAEVSLRAALKAATARAAALEGEAARLAEVTIPLAAERLRAGVPADAVLANLPRPTQDANCRLLSILIAHMASSTVPVPVSAPAPAPPSAPSAAPGYASGASAPLTTPLSAPAAGYAPASARIDDDPPPGRYVPGPWPTL